MTDKITLLLHDQGPFWDLVKSYQLCWYGITTIYTSEQPLLENNKPLLSLGCKSSDSIFFQHHAEILALKQERDAQQIIYDLDCLLANMAYERVKHLNDQSPEFDFFRHIRNAASHKNSFSFDKDEPRRPAHWRQLTIDHTTKGSSHSLHAQQCFGFFLYSGDLFLLLQDIENKVLKQWLSSVSQ